MPLLGATAGDDRFKFNTFPVLGQRGDALGGSDVLTIRNGGLTIADADFAGFSNLEVLNLVGAGSTVTLGATAAAAFSGATMKVTGGAGLTLDASAFGAAEAVNFVSKAADAAETITTGAGNDRVDAGGGADLISTGAGNDVIVFRNAGDLGEAAGVNGGAGADTLRFLSGGTIADADFADTSNIEGVVLADGTFAITLGTAAAAAFTGGNVSINAVNADAVTVNATALGAAGASFSFNGGAGNDTIIIGGDQAFVRGNGGADTFAFTSLSFTDVIVADFQDGVDRIALPSAILGLATPEQIQALFSGAAVDVDAGVLLSGSILGVEGSVLIRGVTEAQLTAADIVLF